MYQIGPSAPISKVSAMITLMFTPFDYFGFDKVFLVGSVQLIGWSDRVVLIFSFNSKDCIS